MVTIIRTYWLLNFIYYIEEGKTKKQNKTKKEDKKKPGQKKKDSTDKFESFNEQKTLENDSENGEIEEYTQEFQDYCYPKGKM